MNGVINCWLSSWDGNLCNVQPSTHFMRYGAIYLYLCTYTKRRKKLMSLPLSLSWPLLFINSGLILCKRQAPSSICSTFFNSVIFIIAFAFAILALLFTYNFYLSVVPSHHMCFVRISVRMWRRCKSLRNFLPSFYKYLPILQKQKLKLANTRAC